MPDFLHNVAVQFARLRAIRAKREAVLLVRRPVRSGEEPRSYMGGLPCLREDLDWPASTSTGLPLSFIAQIDLRDVPRPRGVFFPAEGLLWFFADLSSEFQTRVLFDPHPGTMARERAAPGNLPPLDRYDHHGWLKAQHPRAFVEPKAGLFLQLFDTFYDWPYASDKSVAFMEMIDELRESAVHRATGVRRPQSSYWLARRGRSGFGEAHWPATSIDAEYALMSLGGDHRLSTALKNHPCPPEVVRDLAARVQDRIGMLRGLGPRPLAPAERAAINALIDEVRRGFARFDYGRRQVADTRIRDYVRWSHRDVRAAVKWSYPHAAFDILHTMPEAEKYVPAEALHPYQELMLGGQGYFHQMFGHGSSPQDAPRTYEDRNFVLLLQIGGSATLGIPVGGDGVMHYWIPKQDLAAGRFDRVEGTWEAG